MDDFFEVLIYLLFIGASVIGGIYKNYAKKKAEERKRQQMSEVVPHSDYKEQEVKSQPSMPKSIEDYLREQFEFEMETEEVSEANIEPEPDLKPEAPKKERVAAFEKTTDTLLSDNLQDKDFSISDEIDKHERNSDKLFAEIDDSHSPIFSDEEEFDAQKAVIYSEIMMRKYS